MKERKYLMYKVYEKIPHNFSPKLSIASCYIEHSGDFLSLKRSSSSPQAKTWGTPAGKIEQGEAPELAAIRELREESGLELSLQNLKSLGKIFIENPKGQYDCFLFYAKLKAKPKITLSKEHTDYTWTKPEEFYKLPIVMGAEEALRIVLKRVNTNTEK